MRRALDGVYERLDPQDALWRCTAGPYRTPVEVVIEDGPVVVARASVAAVPELTGPLEAAHAVRLLGVKHVIGGHWGTFPALTGTPEGLQEEIAKLGLQGVTVHPLRPGDRESF